MNKNRDIRYFILQQLLLACLLYLPVFSFAQYSNFWAFGFNNIMNFNTSAKHFYTNSCGSSGDIPSGDVGTFICDKRGNLLFGLMEDTIVDRNLKPMMNGYSI